MRTVRLELVIPTQLGGEINLQTEVFIDDDDDAEQAGQDAIEFLTAFNEGIQKVADE